MTRSRKVSRRGVLATLPAGLLLARPALAAGAAPEPGTEIDRIVAQFMSAFEVPGIGVAVVRPNAAPLLRGYGVRTLGRPETVDIHTQFAIASNSKAFLAASLAILVDQGRIGWEDSVVRHLPEFRMHDPAVTQMMTVRDLLVHRSGLPLGAGDLMQIPRSDRSAEDILKALPYFKPSKGFRAAYAYDNCLYIVAGLLLQRVSGQSWDDFVQTHLITPLGMSDAVTNPTLVRGPNHAGRHGRLGPPTRGIGKLEVLPADETAVIGPAGGINVSLAGIVPWLQVQLGRGLAANGKRLWSEAQSAEMWTPQTITGSGAGPTLEKPQQSVIQGYALGWGVADYRGRRMLSHSGGLSGQITRTTLLPDQGLGFVVFTNSEEADAVSGLRFALLDHLLGAPPYPWLKTAQDLTDKKRDEVIKIAGTGDFKPPPGGPSLALSAYAGRYRDPWYGDIVVAQSAGGLKIDFTHTPVFKSRLEPFGPDAFRTRFARGAGEDAIVTFLVRDGAVTGVSMRALSPLADFSFDFHDLAFVPVDGAAPPA